MASTIILITGANSGLGFATAKILVCASDAFHVILACRSQEKAESAISEIQALGPKGSLSTLELDVTNQNSIEAAAAKVEEQFGHLDVLVNNAGVGGLAMDDNRARFQLCLDTNVLGPAMVCESFRPLLLNSKNPYSIFITSGARTLTRNALQKPAHFDNIKAGHAYQVSKAALNMLALLEARDYGDKGLKVFVFGPGFVRSNLRGTSEEARSGWGQAGDPDVSAEVILSMIRGERDQDVGRFVHKDGVFEW